MLAHNGLALITEKLQNQKLEETPQSTCCGKLPQVTDSAAKATVVSQSQSNLAVKGKNVWALSLESERQGRHELESPDTKSRQTERVYQGLVAKCRHRKPRISCQYCDSAPGTPTAPPKKKHCRSLSVPPDGLVALPIPSKEPGGKLWKPIAVIPLSSSTIAHDTKSRNSHQSIYNPHDVGCSGSWLPRLSSGFKRVPAVPSPPSVDSGHFTTSDLQTPPGSPVPRPASAASDTSSFSSLGSVCWHEHSPMRTRGVRVLENRSLSCEDRISGSSSTTSMPCVHVQGGCSMELLPSRCRSSSQDGVCGGGGDSGSGGIPRCHSQPCVLHHRRCGKKRRRDCDRPTLNFNKMTETAYTRSHRRSEPWSTPVPTQQSQISGLHDFSERCSSRTGFSLNPIASSPLDSDLPGLSSRQLADSDLAHAASIALPLTPPDQAPLPFQMVASARGGRDDVEDEDEDDEEDGEDVDHSNCNCHDSRTDDGVELFPMNDLDLEQIENH